MTMQPQAPVHVPSQAQQFMQAHTAILPWSSPGSSPSSARQSCY